MAVGILTSLVQQFDSNGDPLSGGFIYVYDAGTTTPKSLYTDTGLSVSTTNPITLDSAGRHGMVYIATGTYKLVIKNSSSVTQYTRDSIDPGVPIGSGTLAVANGGTGASTAAAALTNLGAASSADLTAVSSDLTTVANLVTAVGPGKVLGGSFAPGGTTGNAGERILPLGQCRLTKSGSNLLLSPRNGNLLMISSKLYAIPSAGITLAPGGSNATFYYIYCYDNSGTLTLEQSTTAPAVDTDSGIAIKNGDSTRTLVGAAYTDTGPAWADTDGKLWVISYFNRRPKTSLTTLTADRTTTSGTYGEINSEIRNQFIQWSDETARAWLTGTTSNSGANQNRTGLAIDSTTAITADTNISAASGFQNISLFVKAASLTENAVHYITVLANVAGGTGTWNGTAPGINRLTVQTMG